MAVIPTYFQGVVTPGDPGQQGTLSYVPCNRGAAGSFRMYTEQDLCQLLAPVLDLLRASLKENQQRRKCSDMRHEQDQVEHYDKTWIAPLTESIKTVESLVGTNTCSHCDCTGDVHSIDGEWRGHCEACQPNKRWVENVEYLLKQCPHTIRVREGGGPESLLDSLIVTFMLMESRLAGLSVSAEDMEMITDRGDQAKYSAEAMELQEKRYKQRR